MTQAKTSIKGQFPDAFVGQQEVSYLEIQLVDEHDNAVAGISVKAENQATRDAFMPPETLYATTDENGVARFDGLHPLDVTLYVEEQRLAEEMALRPLRLGREKKDSTVKPRAEESGYVWHYVKIGELCKKLPEINEWKSEKIPEFHFPDEHFKGFLIAESQLNQRHVIEICPFRAWILKLTHSEHYSIVNAYNLGMLSDLAYAQQDAVEGFFDVQCQDLSRIPQVQEYPSFYHAVAIDVPFENRYLKTVFIDTSTGENPEGDTQLFYVYNNVQVIVAWRGTEPDKLQDVITDLTFRPVPCPDLTSQGMVHKGFYEAYGIIKNKYNVEFNDLFEKINVLDFFVCGHSLGGALSLILSVDMKEGKPIVYTYGMPRVFTMQAINVFSHTTHYRHVNDADTVASIPPQADLDNFLYDFYGPPGVVLGFYSSFWSMLPQVALGVKFGDPYWHHGNLVSFLKAEQSMIIKRSQSALWLGHDSTNYPSIEISYKLTKRVKLYLVPSLNDDCARDALNNQKEFISHLDRMSLKKFFPKNTNPDLDTLITNPGDHSMATQYMPFINNQLIELIDESRVMKRKKSRAQFAEQMNRIASTGQADNNETARNRMFIQLQDMLVISLSEKDDGIVGKNALERFNHVAEEEIEQVD